MSDCVCVSGSFEQDFDSQLLELFSEEAFPFLDCKGGSPLSTIFGNWKKLCSTLWTLRKNWFVLKDYENKILRLLSWFDLLIQYEKGEWLPFEIAYYWKSCCWESC